MKAFISYSIREDEKYILSLLAQKMSEIGFALVAGFWRGQEIDFQTVDQINNSVLFIGLITGSGPPAKTRRVYAEFRQARSFNKPSILLIENNVEVAPEISNYPNMIRFDRHSIHYAVEDVKFRIKNQETIPSSPDAAAWILGGLAVVGLLALLSDSEK